MGDTLDKTTVSTIALLEARLLRIEHLLYGPTAIPERPPTESAMDTLASIERRFSNIISRVRVYAELLKIYRSHPSLFQPPAPEAIPTQLSPEAVRATVLAYAPAYHAAAASLAAATADTPVPDAALSAHLASQMPRLRGIAAVQAAQQADAAALRRRGERVLRAWYEGRVVPAGRFVAEAEARVERVERAVRRAERARESDEV